MRSCRLERWFSNQIGLLLSFAFIMINAQASLIPDLLASSSLHDLAIVSNSDPMTSRYVLVVIRRDSLNNREAIRIVGV